MARYARQVGRAAVASGGVEEILGRSANTYAERAAGHAAAFRNYQEGQGNR
jgi:hypothetical protein